MMMQDQVATVTRASEAVVVAVVLLVPFLFALVLPSLTDTTSGGWPGVVLIAAVTLMEAPLAALACWAVRRGGDSLSTIGVVRPHFAWLAVAVIVLVGVIWVTWLRHTGAWDGAASSSGAGGGSYTTAQRIALVLLGVPQIYLQELIYRGFAIAFLHRLTGSTIVAVLIASAAFAVAHITSLGGNLAVSLASVFVVAILLSALYLATRDLTSVFVIHWAWVAWLAVGLSTNDAATVAQSRMPVS